MSEGIKIIGKVHSLRQTEKSVFCSLNIYNQKAKVGAFLNIAFIKEAFEPATRLENKDKVEITEGFITADEYKGIKSLKLIVSGFKNLTNPDADSEGEEYQQSSDESEEPLPF